MSDFHYVRTLGEDGGVDAVDGPAEGVSLSEVLKEGLPPFKVVLELVAALCEILDIADQDGEVHGDIGPGCVFVDDVGAISVEGFGVERKQSPSPEGTPKGSVTDVYGLGRVCYAIMTPREFPDVPDDDPDEHDDLIIDNIIQMNFGDLPEDMVGDIQWYLAKFLSFEREDRPSPVDAWRTFIAFADEVEGPYIEDWAVDAIEGGGERRDQDEALQRPEPAAGFGEELGGPAVSQGPLSQGAINFGGGGGGKSGTATAFWSKDQMKAALDAEEDEDDGFRPVAGGGGATSFWSREQLDAMREGKAEAPRPKRGGGGGQRRPAKPPGNRSPGTGAQSPPPSTPKGTGPQTMFMAPPEREPAATAAPPPPPPPVASAPPPPPVASASAPSASPFAAQTSPTNPVAAPAQTPVAVAATPVMPARTPQYEDEDEGGGGGMGIIIAVAVLLILGIICAGVLFLGGGMALILGNKSDGVDTQVGSSTEVVEVVEVDVEETDEDTDEVEEEVVETQPTPTSSSRKRSSSSRDSNSSSSSRSSSRSSSSPSSSSSRQSSSSSTSPSSSSRSSSSSSRSSGRSTSSSRRSSSSTPPVVSAPSGPALVRFKVTGRGTIRCGNGQTSKVDGAGSMKFSGSLPVTCMVTLDDGHRCAGSVAGAGTCNCNPPNDELVCR